jgi:hypothetical protein
MSGLNNLFSLLLSPAWVQTFVMTFLGEWGDRSQIATIAMAAGSDYWWVTGGAVVGHGCCTAVAVIGGRAIAGKVSMRVGKFDRVLTINKEYSNPSYSHPWRRSRIRDIRRYLLDRSHLPRIESLDQQLFLHSIPFKSTHTHILYLITIVYSGDIRPFTCNTSNCIPTARYG